MPVSPDPQDRSPLTVEQLLRAKRAERPRDEFWTGFEERLRERMLREVVAPTPRPAAWTLRRRWVALGFAAAAAALVSLVPLARFGQVSPVEVPVAEGEALASAGPEAPAALEVALVDAPEAVTPRPQFVTDQLRASEGVGAFQRVLASEVMTAGAVAAVYVAYPIGRSADASSSATLAFDRF